MPSLIYKLFKKPMTVDDCIDYIGGRKPTSLRISAKVNGMVREWYLITQFLVELELQYDDKSIVVEKVCGGFMDTEASSKKHHALTQANLKLKEIIERVSAVFPSAETESHSFEYHIPGDTRMENKRIQNPYSQFTSTQLILRDQLAIDRTVLANERTLLSYVRTALAFALTGVGCIKFFKANLVYTIGGIFIAVGVVILAIGFWRFVVVGRNIKIAGSEEIRTDKDEHHGSAEQQEAGADSLHADNSKPADQQDE